MAPAVAGHVQQLFFERSLNISFLTSQGGSCNVLAVFLVALLYASLMTIHVRLLREFGALQQLPSAMESDRLLMCAIVIYSCASDHACMLSFSVCALNSFSAASVGRGGRIFSERNVRRSKRLAFEKLCHAMRIDAHALLHLMSK